jgi:[amino group carrier protein]-6-phospho-L-2-aminoadipate/5-phospho-L-glutamate reductase
VTPPRVTASVVGGSGYVGGELIRLLTAHPHVEVRQVTSASQAGQFIHAVHPNLRGVSTVQFTNPDALERVDVLFLGLPHGEAAHAIDRFASQTEYLIDCSADFRLRDAAAFQRWYGEPHPAPAWLDRFVYGLPERHRSALRDARFASGVGCNATVTTLALAPLADQNLIERVVADVKVGSSEAGARASQSSHHPERSGAVRSFMPVGHRHQAEIRQSLGDNFELDFSVTSVELVRGALVTAHCFLRNQNSERDLWKIFRSHYADEPFVRLVAGKAGIHRYPEPKILAGSNFCDIGFAVDERSRSNRVVVIGAIDNLMKGAAGSAVQCMNLMVGFEETAGLTFPGLHPI